MQFLSIVLLVSCNSSSMHQCCSSKDKKFVTIFCWLMFLICSFIHREKYLHIKLNWETLLKYYFYYTFRAEYVRISSPLCIKSPGNHILNTVFLNEGPTREIAPGNYYSVAEFMDYRFPVFSKKNWCWCSNLGMDTRPLSHAEHHNIYIL